MTAKRSEESKGDMSWENWVFRRHPKVRHFTCQCSGNVLFFLTHAHLSFCPHSHVATSVFPISISIFIFIEDVCPCVFAYLCIYVCPSCVLIVMCAVVTFSFRLVIFRPKTTTQMLGLWSWLWHLFAFSWSARCWPSRLSVVSVSVSIAM